MRDFRHRPVELLKRPDDSAARTSWSRGADGVIVAGCHPGDCHYAEGNYKALRRYRMLKRLVKEYGIEEPRLRLEWISASEGDKVRTVVNEMTEQVRALGPLDRVAEGLFPEAFRVAGTERREDDASRAANAGRREGTPGDATDELAPEEEQLQPPELKALTRRQQQQIWDAVRGTSNFWETLAEIEPGIVSRLAVLSGRALNQGARIELQRRGVRLHALLR